MSLDTKGHIQEKNCKILNQQKALAVYWVFEEKKDEKKNTTHDEWGTLFRIDTDTTLSHIETELNKCHIWTKYRDDNTIPTDKQFEITKQPQLSEFRFVPLTNSFVGMSHDLSIWEICRVTDTLACGMMVHESISPKSIRNLVDLLNARHNNCCGPKYKDNDSDCYPRPPRGNCSPRPPRGNCSPRSPTRKYGSDFESCSPCRTSCD